MATTVAEFTKIQLHELGISLSAPQFNKLLEIINSAELDVFFSPESLVTFIKVQANKLLESRPSPPKYQPPMLGNWAAHVNCKKSEDLNLQLQQAEINLQMAKDYILKAERDIQELKKKMSPMTSPKSMSTNSSPRTETHRGRHRGGRKHRAKKQALEAKRVVVATRRN